MLVNIEWLSLKRLHKKTTTNKQTNKQTNKKQGRIGLSRRALYVFIPPPVPSHPKHAMTFPTLPKSILPVTLTLKGLPLMLIFLMVTVI